ncbi:hypothetical protein LIA77_01635 [Sarocladium implicatum]|nr:hypothetical protein LIA77_01635 [Sarocladium implicatum]
MSQWSSLNRRRMAPSYPGLTSVAGPEHGPTDSLGRSCPIVWQSVLHRYPNLSLTKVTNLSYSRSPRLTSVAGFISILTRSTRTMLAA